jgi:phage shock protein PspC (stress-responsive transcriptional regulator)
MNPSPGQSTVVAVGLLVLIGVVAGIALNEYDVDEFLKVWAVLGTLVGVVTGAVPAYFFAITASKAEDERKAAEDAKALADQRLQLVLGLAPAETLEKAREIDPSFLKSS